MFCHAAYAFGIRRRLRPIACGNTGSGFRPIACGNTGSGYAIAPRGGGNTLRFGGYVLVSLRAYAAIILGLRAYAAIILGLRAYAAILLGLRASRLPQAVFLRPFRALIYRAMCGLAFDD